MKSNWKKWKEKIQWKAWYGYLLAAAVCLILAVPALKAYTQWNNAAHILEENKLETIVTQNVQDYLASYVVTDGFVKTLTADADLSEQLAEKMSSNTSLLTEEQINDIVAIAIDHYRILSEMSIDDLSEEQIKALETSIHENIESILARQEDIRTVSSGVSAIIEKNLIRQLESMDASISQLQKEIDIIKSNILGSKDLEELNLSLSEMVADIDSLNGHITEVKENMSSEDQKLNQNMDTISSDIDNLHGYCDETATVLIKIRAYMDDMNHSSITSLGKEMENIYLILEAAADAIDKINEKLPVIENDIDEIGEGQTDISELKKEIEKLKGSVSSMASNISDLKAVVQDNQEKTDKLFSKLQAEDIAILNKIDTLNKTFSTLQREARDAINNLTTKMSTAAKNISSLQTTTESALSDIGQIKKEIEALQRDKLAVIDVVNSLTSTDSSKALSAAMGYQLEQELQALQGKVSEIEVTINNITNGEMDGSLQAQIDELRKTVQDCFTYVSEGKKNLAAALADKGVTVDAAAGFDAFVTGIGQIGLDGSATENTILEGYSAYVANQYVAGSMPEVGNINVTLKAGEMYHIPEGYHSGAGNVTAESMQSQTPGTAVAAHISAGDTAWVNGEMLTGTMKNNGAPNAVLNAGDKCTLAPGCYSGGDITARDLASQTPGDAAADNISAGKTAWVNGEMVTGNGKDRDKNNANILDSVIGNGGIVEAGEKGTDGTAPPVEIDLSGYGSYQTLTVNDLLIYPVEVEGTVYHWEESGSGYYIGGCGVSHTEFYKEYDPATGVLKIKPNVKTYKLNDNVDEKNLGGTCGYYKVKVYLIK